MRQQAVATNTWNIYINGILKTTVTAKYYPSTSVTRTSSYIGRSNWGDPYYNGVIDDFRIYNTVLTAQQVNTVYLGSGYGVIFSGAGSNIASNTGLPGTVNIQHPVVAVGQGTHTLAYSPDGVRWTGLGTTMFSSAGYSVAWNGTRWIAGGIGTNTLAYSYDGLRWTGLGATIFSTQVNSVAWNGSIWVAGGSGTNDIAISPDGLTWTGSPTANAIFTSCNAVAWNGTQWVAVGAGTNSIAYSTDGFVWTAIGSTVFSTQGNGVCWTGSSGLPSEPARIPSRIRPTGQHGPVSAPRSFQRPATAFVGTALGGLRSDPAPIPSRIRPMEPRGSVSEQVCSPLPATVSVGPAHDSSPLEVIRIPLDIRKTA